MTRTTDGELLELLRAGDEDAFRVLVDTHASAMLRVARSHVSSAEVAEEVVQETWLGVLNGLDRFEGRSSLKTWIFRILTNIASTRGARESRSRPFSSLARSEAAAGPLALDPDRFLSADHERWPHHWAIGPAAWPAPDDDLLAGETRAVIAGAIEALPPAQRAVISLRDVEGWAAEEVCATLEISAGNQRVLLHRARTRVRSALEDYLGAAEPTLA